MWPKFRANTALQSISPSLRDIRLNSVKAWQMMAEWKWKIYYFVISVSAPTRALWDSCTGLLPPGLQSTFCHPFTPNGIRKEEGDGAGCPPVGPSSLYVWPLIPHWICPLSVSKRGIINTPDFEPSDERLPLWVVGDRGRGGRQTVRKKNRLFSSTDATGFIV